MRAELEARQAQGPLSSLMGGGGGGASTPGQNFDVAAYLAGSKEGSGNGNGGSSKNKAVKRK